MRFAFPLFTALLLPRLSSAQGPTPELHQQLAQAVADSTRLRLLNEISAAFEPALPDSGIVYGTQAEAMALKLGNEAALAEACKNIGYGHIQLEHFAIARSYLQRSLDIWTRLNNEQQQIKLYRLLGNVAQQQADLPEALKRYLAAMRLVERSSDRAALADLTSTVGNVYDMMGDPNGSITRQREALRIYEDLKDSLGIARVSNNLGLALDVVGKHDEALTFLERAVGIAKKLGDPMGMAICTGSIANHHQRIGELEKALAYQDEVRGYFEQMGDPFDQAASHINSGQILTELKRYDEARAHLEKGVALADTIGALQWSQNGHAALYDLAMAQGDQAMALKHYKQYITFRDSITNEANTRKAVQVEMQYAFDKKEAETKAEQEEKDQRQRLVRNGIAGGLLFALLFLGVVWRQRNRISKEKKRSEELLLNILPEEVADELKAKGHADAKHFDTATILFTDFKGFTQLSEQVSPAELVAELNSCFKAFDHIMEKHRIEKIKTIGDAYMAAGGLPDPQHGSPADVVRASLEMQDFMKQHKAEREAQGKPFFEMRVGVHSGPVVAGIVGVKKFQYDIWGDTVNTASRMESSGEVGQVNISEATHALVKNETGLTFRPRGKVQAKGKGEMEMYFVGRSLGEG